MGEGEGLGIFRKIPGYSGIPKLAVRFKSSGYSGHFPGIFGKSRISGKFPGISEASLDNTSHLGEKVITFYSRLRIR
jgi:hypothetical protein